MNRLAHKPTDVTPGDDLNGIIDGLLYYDDFGVQATSALNDIDDQLIDLGVIDSDKWFANPDS